METAIALGWIIWMIGWMFFGGVCVSMACGDVAAGVRKGEVFLKAVVIIMIGFFLWPFFLGWIVADGLLD